MPSRCRIVLLFACGLFALACMLPAIESPTPLGPFTGSRSGPEFVFGLTCLLGGPLTLEEKPWWFLAWLANPLAFIGWIGRYFKRTRFARWPFGAACLLGCVPWGSLLAGSLSDLLIGYYLWQLSIIACFIWKIATPPRGQMQKFE